MRLQNFQNYIFANEQCWPPGSTEKFSIVFFVVCENHVSTFFTSQKFETLFRIWKPCFSLSCLTENGNPVSPFMRHRKWKPCFSLFCLSENGNPVSPCFAPQKMETLFLLVLRHRRWKACFTLLLLTEKWKTLFRLALHHRKWNPVSPCFASQKTANPSFLEGFVWLLVFHVASYSFFLRKKVKGNPACP